METTIKLQPDLVIADIMMPELNGIDLCKKLKADIKTRHIPVIIHSVKNYCVTLPQVLEAGADDFIMKPFDYKMLSLKINNILESRKHLLINTYKEKLIQPSIIEIPSEQEELLKDIFRVVEKNMSDSDFNVEKLCQLMAMSRMNLHRKLHAITGKAASEFIREVRMKRAGQLLASGSKRISEVMYETGISSNYHFNKYFKEMYGVSPKEYIRMQSQEQ